MEPWMRTHGGAPMAERASAYRRAQRRKSERGRNKGELHTPQTHWSHRAHVVHGAKARRTRLLLLAHARSRRQGHPDGTGRGHRTCDVTQAHSVHSGERRPHILFGRSEGRLCNPRSDRAPLPRARP